MIHARAAAITLLQQSRHRRGFASELLDHWFQQHPDFPAVDRRLVTQLVCGVIRRRATLDALIAPFIQRPLATVEPVLRDLLRLGAYQLAILTHIPPYAAVHATVAAATELQLRRASGLLNAVLRRLAAVVSDDCLTAPAADAVPLEEPIPPPLDSLGSPQLPSCRYRRLRQPLLPDPQTHPLHYLATAFSYPRPLLSRWLSRYSWEHTLRYAAWFNTPPALWIRVNCRVISRETYRLRLAAAGIDAYPGPHPQSLYLPDPPPITQLPGYAEGEFTVQDHSAMLVASALEPKPGWHILDLCAAPGGKTTHLAELMHDQGRIIACDIDQCRLETLHRLTQRLRLQCVVPHCLPPHAPPPDGPFDAALVDVPCSNTGVLHRRPEARWRWRSHALNTLRQRQTQLLLHALAVTRPGGPVIYSTCSLEPEENEQLICAVRRAVPHLRIELQHHALPGQPADGAYYARLRRRR
jgi:16S rRNA (cytosine967-C5)-methyltransferase